MTGTIDHEAAIDETPDGGALGDEPPGRGWVGPNNPIRLLPVIAGIAAVGVFVGQFALFVVLALLISVFLHELGHFWVARRSGMKCTEFFIGIGPRLWSMQRGEVEYGVKAFPIAAYVRIIGMHNLEPVPAEDEDRTYRVKSYPRRLATVIAGPAMNLLLAVLIVFGVLLTTGDVFAGADDSDWVVDGVLEESAAAAAGVQPGDRIVRVAGEEVGGWGEFTDQLDDRAGETVEFVVERDGESLAVTAELDWRLAASGAAAVPADPPLPPQTSVLAVDGEPVEDFAAFREQLASGGPPVELLLELGDAEYRLEVERPLELPDDGARGFLGVSNQLDFDEVEPLGVAEAASGAVMIIPDTAGNMAEFLGRLFSPSGLSRYADMVRGAGTDRSPEPGTPELQPVDEDAEPMEQRVVLTEDDEIRPLSVVGIVHVGGQLGDAGGWVALLYLLAIVNIFLGFINLVPLLPFDGGHAAVATYEAIRGVLTRRTHRVDVAKLMPLTYLVVFLLVGLGVSAIYLDIVDPFPVP